MKARELLSAAAQFVEHPQEATGGLWARAATILARQALETDLANKLSALAPGSPAAKLDAQLVVLCEVLPDKDLARRVRYTWGVLSSASHYQSYELPPTADELRDWLRTVEALLSAAPVS
jgi:hypothetical protein